MCPVQTVTYVSGRSNNLLFSGIENRKSSHAYDLALTTHKVLEFLGSLYSAASGLDSSRLNGPGPLHLGTKPVSAKRTASCE